MARRGTQPDVFVARRLMIEGSIMVRAIGINHVALEVGGIDEALAWYGRFFRFELRGRRTTMAWIDLADQFVALAQGRTGQRNRLAGLILI